ncbi:MAG: feruloyl-CoA synthase [Proteobacteria bacterium]|nr:MAG: feruloyl-CoA synthase [Pseudomonadota bacterium]
MASTICKNQETPLTTQTLAKQPRLSPIAGRFCDLTVDMHRDAGGVIRLLAKEPLKPYPDRIHDHLWHWAEVRPARTFLAERRPGYEGWAEISYAETAAQVDLIARALAERELGPDRPILILSGNAIEHQLLGLAAMTAGVPFAPISVAYSLISQDLGKLRYITSLLDPGLVYAADGARFARALAIPEMAGREIVVGSPAAEVPGATPFAELAKGGSAARLARAAARIGADTIAKFLFTSGSTGTPKGVTITQRMLNSNMAMFEQIWPFIVERPPVLIDWLPWSHVFGGNHNMGQVLRSGGTLYIDDGKPTPADFERSLRNLGDVSSTMYLNVPKGFELLLPVLAKDAALRGRFFADLDAMFYAAATLPEHLWHGLAELAQRERPHNPPSMISGWGLTETAPGSLILNRHDAEIGNIGPPLPGQEVKLVPNGDKLEIRVRGPNVTPGYWRAPELTRQAFDEEGYFITGDAVTFVDAADASRGFRFNGRVAEDFKLSSGTKVHAAAIWARARQALGTLVFDVVLAAPDRDELGLLVFPPPGRANDGDYRDALRDALNKMNEGVTGSSQVVARALVLREPPSLDAGEITDKGSLNSRGIRERRAADVARLYDDHDPEVIRP